MEILTAVEAYLARTGMPATRFGRLAARDPRLVSDLHNGRAPRSAVRERIERFIVAHPTPAPSRRRGRPAA
jgi:hypothetical protein